MSGTEKSSTVDEMDAGCTAWIRSGQVHAELRALIGIHEFNALRALSSKSEPRDDFWSEPFKVTSGN